MIVPQINGETLEPPRPLPWYPDKLAWHMTFSREQLRNNPKLNEVTNFAGLLRSRLRLSRPEKAQSVHLATTALLRGQLLLLMKTPKVMSVA